MHRALAVLLVLLTSCAGSQPPPQQPAPPPAEVVAPQNDEPTPAPAADEATRPPIETPKEAEGVGEIAIDGVHFIIRGTAKESGKGWELTMAVTATAPPNKDVWLFGLQNGMSLNGRFFYNEAVRGGGFGEGGTSTSEHVKGGESVTLTRTYPRNEGDDPIPPGTGVAAHLATSICSEDALGDACHDATIATIKFMVQEDGPPIVEVIAGKDLTE